jgi:hypothetical protein
MTQTTAALEIEECTVRLQEVAEGCFSLKIAQYNLEGLHEATIVLNRDQARKMLEAMKEVVAGPLPHDGQ